MPSSIHDWGLFWTCSKPSSKPQRIRRDATLHFRRSIFDAPSTRLDFNKTHSIHIQQSTGPPRCPPRLLQDVHQDDFSDGVHQDLMMNCFIQDAIRPAAVVLAPQDRLRRAVFFFGWLVTKGFKGLRFFGAGAFALTGLIDAKEAPDNGKKTFFASARSSGVAPSILLTRSVSFFINQSNRHPVHCFLASSSLNSLEVSPLNSISC
jgi:hypothetical protein